MHSIAPDVTTTEESIGIPVPTEGVDMVIPDVSPGVYRIVDSVDSNTGSVIVNVIGG